MKILKIISIMIASIILLIIGWIYIYYQFNRHVDIKFYEGLPKEDWTKTAPGRYAHSLKYEDKLAKPVPYDISSPWFFTSDATKEKRSEDYFEHLCNTEAGNYVWKTAQPQKSIALLRGFELPEGKVKRRTNSGNYEDSKFSVDEYFYARDGWEAPGLVNYFYAMQIEEQKYSYGENNIGLKKYDDFMSLYANPYKNYEIWFNQNYIIKYLIDGQYNPDISSKFIVNKEDKLTSRYGITWRGFSRPHDREYGIAGGDLIIVDLQTNEVVAVQRNFAKARMKGDRYNWYFPLGCFELYKNGNQNLKYSENSSFNDKLKLINHIDNIRSVEMPFILDVLPSTLIEKTEKYTGYQPANENAKKIIIKNK